MGELSFGVERFIDVYMEMERHFEAHYQELATLKNHISKVDPDYLMYINLEHRGNLHTVTARDGEKLVGYYVGALMQHPHYKQVLAASADLYYLAQDYRKAQNGILFIQFIEESLRKRGVQLTAMNTKMQKDLGALYEASGYIETDRVFRKWLAV